MFMTVGRDGITNSEEEQDMLKGGILARPTGAGNRGRALRP